MALSRIARTLGAAAFCVIVGCGPEVKPRPEVLKEASPDVEAKIREALNKAGITKEIATINDMDDKYLVTMKLDGLGPNGEPPPGRPAPEKAYVDKKTFEVTKVEMPKDDRRGGGQAIPVPGAPPQS